MKTDSPQWGHRFATFFFTAIFVIILVNWPYIPSNDYSKEQLAEAYDYVQLVGRDATVLLYPDGQPTTKIYGNQEFVKASAEYLRRSRPGRYRSAWSAEDIAIISVSNFFTADLEARQRQIRDLPIAEFIKRDMMALPPLEIGCYAKDFGQYGWAIGGYVLVDVDYLRSRGERDRDCVLAGFDAVDGFPVSRNSFDLNRIPGEDVRRAVIDYVRLCSREGISDALPVVRSRYGISSLPSLGCVARKLQAKLTGAL